jgi:hypothetical protein
LPLSATRRADAQQALAGERARAYALREKVERAEATAAGERSMADALRERLDMLQTELQRDLELKSARAQSAEQAEALRQAADARKARGRLRLAWDGWLGR